MKIGKRFLTTSLTVLILLTAVPLAGFVGLELVPKAQAYNVGDTILFGTYPQTRVEETPELEAAAEAATWKSYGYYSGTGSIDGNMMPGDFMQFADFFSGNEKYRAVTFSTYRPNSTGGRLSDQISYQDNNGYAPSIVYYFKYEPLMWRILDPSVGYIMCESLIDAQAYQNIAYQDTRTSTYYQGVDSSVYANNFATSTIRDWLNDDFYETAFTQQQKNHIETPTTPLDNSSPHYDGKFSFAETYDKIYLISYADATNPEYGFITSSNSDIQRCARGTDYAQCQGLRVIRSSGASYDGNSEWYLRSPGSGSYAAPYAARRVDCYGSTEYNGAVYSTCYGIRPACCISDLQDDFSQSEALFSAGIHSSDSGESVKTYDTILFGTYPQTQVDKTPKLEAAAQTATWKSYGYFSDTGSGDGSMAPSDFMQFADFFADNEKYRAVMFSAYRPDNTGAETGTSRNFQDENGYTPNDVYFFKYEPLMWRVIDPSAGYIMCENIIDSQAYQNTLYKLDLIYWNDNRCSIYANDYATSSIRDWLNYDFYETAFTQRQKNNIETPVTPLDNSSPYNDGQYSSSETYDKIYLISYADAMNPAYELNSTLNNDGVKQYTEGTDYAQCQGLFVYDSGSVEKGNSWWWMRSPGNHSLRACIGDAEEHRNLYNVNCTFVGVRPACCISNLQDDVSRSEALFSGGVHEHTPGKTVIENETSATCAATGSFDEVVYCTECGAELSRNIKTVEKLAHTVRFVNVAKTADDGYIGEATCTVCGGTAKIGDIIPAADTDRFQSWDESKSAITAMCFNGDFGTVSSGAFSDFPNLGYVIFNAPSVTLAANAFSNCPELEAVLFFGDAAIDAAAFDTDASTVQIYRPQSAAFSFTPSDGKFHTIPFSFADGVLHLNGSVTWDGYQFLDTMTAFCLQFDPIDVVTCTDFTFDGLTLYAVQASGKKTRIEDNRLENAELRAAIGDQEETVLTFNALVRGIADGSISDFRMLAKDEDHEEIKDTPLEIKDDTQEDEGGFGGFIRKAIKWVVRLIDSILKVLKVFGKK